MRRCSGPELARPNEKSDPDAPADAGTQMETLESLACSGLNFHSRRAAAVERGGVGKAKWCFLEAHL